MKFIVIVAVAIGIVGIATPSFGACSGSNNLTDVLEQVGNLLANLVENLPILQQLGLTGKGNLLDLNDLLVSLGDLLTDTLGTGLNTPTQPLVDLLSRIVSQLNTSLGGKQGTEWSCNSNKGSAGTDIGNLVQGIHLYPGVPNLLIGLVRVLISLLSSLLRGLGIPVPANFGIPAGALPTLG